MEARKLPAHRTPTAPPGSPSVAHPVLALSPQATAACGSQQAVPGLFWQDNGRSRVCGQYLQHCHLTADHREPCSGRKAAPVVSGTCTHTCLNETNSSRCNTHVASLQPHFSRGPGWACCAATRPCLVLAAEAAVAETKLICCSPLPCLLLLPAGLELEAGA
jgi:hypothetical protein